MRTIIDIPQQALAQLDGLCKREGISRAEAIRRAVSIYLRQQTPADSDEAFGLWQNRKTQGREYEDALRDEWGSPDEPGS